MFVRVFILLTHIALNVSLIEVSLEFILIVEVLIAVPAIGVLEDEVPILVSVSVIYVLPQLIFRVEELFRKEASLLLQTSVTQKTMVSVSEMLL